MSLFLHVLLSWRKNFSAHLHISLMYGVGGEYELDMVHKQIVK